MNRSGLILLVLMTAGLGACGSHPPIVPNAGTNCLGLADDLKTLRVGDELPRVVQVLGMPNRAYRANAWFGLSYDVLEYNAGGTPCARAVLHIDKKLQVLFDTKGQYIGSGSESYLKFRRWMTTSETPLLLDPVVLQP